MCMCLWVCVCVRACVCVTVGGWVRVCVTVGGWVRVCLWVGGCVCVTVGGGERVSVGGCACVTVGGWVGACLWVGGCVGVTEWVGACVCLWVGACVYVCGWVRVCVSVCGCVWVCLWVGACVCVCGWVGACVGVRRDVTCESQSRRHLIFIFKHRGLQTLPLDHYTASPHFPLPSPNIQVSHTAVYLNAESFWLVTSLLFLLPSGVQCYPSLPVTVITCAGYMVTSFNQTNEPVLSFHSTLIIYFKN